MGERFGVSDATVSRAVKQVEDKVRNVKRKAGPRCSQNTPQPQMEGFAVTCPLAPDAPRLISGFCSSPRRFGFGFLQTPPRDDAVAVSPSLRLCENLAAGLPPT